MIRKQEAKAGGRRRRSRLDEEQEGVRAEGRRQDQETGAGGMGQEAGSGGKTKGRIMTQKHEVEAAASGLSGSFNVRRWKYMQRYVDH